MNVVSFHDPVIDGQNMEDTDLYEWQRRPGFSIFCSEPLIDGEIVNQFDFMRNLNGEVIDFVDTNLRLAMFTTTAITALITKTTPAQGFITTLQNLVYFSDGASADMQVWNSVEPISAVNPYSWGLAAPTTTPTVYNLGMWLPKTEYGTNEPVVDPNGNVEIAFIEVSGPTSQTQGYTTESVIPIAGSYNAPWNADQHSVPGYHWWNASTPTNTYSNFISFQGFGFSIPSNAVILGVVVNITKCGIANNTASYNQDYRVQLTIGGVPSGTNEAKVGDWAEGRLASVVAESLKTYTYGDRNNLWGLPLTPAIVNAPGFGIALAAQSMGNPGSYPFVDGSPYPPTIQVYYQLPIGPAGSGTTGLNEPVWSTVINSPTQDGTVTWTNVGPIQNWYPVTNYSLPVVILDTNGNLQAATNSTNPIVEWNAGHAYAVGEEATFGGQYWVAVAANTNVPPAVTTTVTTTGATTTTQAYWINVPNPVTTGPVPPTWATAIGAETTDNDYTWTNIGPGALIESFGTSYVYGFRTIDGHLTTCSPISINTGTILGPQSVGITAFSITSGVVTFTGVNNFVPGDMFTVNGFEIGIYLNGQAFEVLAAGLTTTSFSANFVYSNVGSTSDTGQTAPLIATVTGVGTGSVLCNSTATITAIAVLANIVTVTAVNDFVAGLYVTFSGLTNAMWLNNLQLQVINVDPNGTWFEVYYQTPTNSTSTPDTGTVTFNAVEIYRVSDGGGIYLFAGAVTNPGQSIPWTYNDFTTDANLNIFQIAPQSHLNDPPPGAPGSTVLQSGTITKYWQGRIWMVVGNFVYFSAGPDCTNGIPEQAWPPANRFQFAGPVLNLIPTPDGVGLLTYLADRVNVILGGPETISFYPTDAFSEFGISNPNAVFRTRTRIGQFTTQRQYSELAGAEEEIGEHIADYLSANFNAADTYVTMHRDGNDVGVFLSNGVDQVLRFGSNIQAWSVPAYPVGGAGALRSIETSVGTYSLMLASPAASTPTSIPPKYPTLGTSIGTGTAWVNPNNITAGNPTSYATVTLTGSASETLSASNFGMNVPAGAIIQGVKVAITGKTISGSGGYAETVGMGTDVSVPSGTAWQNPNNIAVASQSTSVVLGTSSVSDYLACTNLGFAVPPTAQILGITVAFSGIGVETQAADTTQTSFPPVSNPWNSIAIGFDSSSTPSVINSPNPGGSHITQTSSANSMTMPTTVSNAGDLLVVSAVWKVVTTVTPSISDDFSNHWTKCLDYTANGIRQVIWSAIANASTGADNIYIGSGANVTLAAAGIFEVANMTGTFSVTATNFGTGDNPTAGNLAATTPNTFALGVASAYPNSINTYQVGLGWTQPAIELNANDGTNFLRISWEYKTIAGAPTDGTLTIAPIQFPTQTKSFVLNQALTAISEGSATDLWGGTWTPAMINSASFGFQIQGLATDTASTYVLYNPMTVTVYYAPELVVTPLGAVAGAESDKFILGTSNTTVTFGGFADLWGMPWISPSVVNANTFGFGIAAAGAPTAEFAISEVQVTVYYGGTYLLARDLNSWGDGGVYGENNGSPYSDCYITVGSITLSQLGGELFPLSHVVGYFDAAGTLNDGAPSWPNIWILPNEVNDTKGIGFVELPETIQEPPVGQNHPSESLLALRWNVNMMNSQLASQFVHHLQVKIQFEPENAPNTIKAIAFKEDQRI